MHLETTIYDYQTVVNREKWLGEKRAHEQRISELIDDYLLQRSHHIKDPVMDFLFEYYAFRPSHLKRWSPGFGVMLQGAIPEDELEIPELTYTDTGARLDASSFPHKRRKSVRWILQLLEHTAQAKPSFGCFGMHEWAMVYKEDELRHQQLGLRMEPGDLARFVESRPLVCTHYDAFRFFTPPARPLNKFQPDRDTFTEMEQPGCLHTNMDLYKWAFKHYPWISSSTIRKAFELALETRIIDMKASPYDLSDYGLEPIKIETEKGRLEYLEEQQKIYEKAMPVREQLIKEYRDLAEALEL